ncbi:T9SS type A sorting domain-containing protein [Aureispira anguillae]|uniref:T9SS type A sorting domain-containing protein n=1 Tax=Aureispira anguillae TaxID=2864201 RepID=A0A916DRY8_9BACT|nr:T9SS type A sorting domain-containing protein [Aureispira anguillae]BDS10707.1 T9SS type A sorting domain-containing protein [Aureispira anguillae]
MKYFFILFSLGFFSSCFAQQYDKNWLLGGHTALPSAKAAFSSSTLIIDTLIRNMPITRTALSMSDSLGNLIFYSNGIKVHNAQHQLMQNGDSLNPGQIANNNSVIGYTINEGIISIPHPSQANKYYIFHQAATYTSVVAGFAEKLYYTLIDMNANGGLGKVEKKNQILLENDSMCGGQLEVVKHGNGRDWWLIQPMSGSNGYHIFLIEGNAINYHHKQYLGASKILGSEVAGQATFSHDGNKYFRYDYRNDLDIYDFDRCTGLLSNYLHIPIIDSIDNITNSFVLTGVASSPNDRYLYVSSWIYLYQFDLWASNIAASIDTVAVYDNYKIGNLPTLFGFIQSAPNGKIYSMISSAPYLHVINNPNIGGIGSNTIQRAVNIYYNNSHIPNLPHYRTPTLSGSACDTITSIETVETPEKEIQIYPNPTSGLVYIEAVQEIEQLSIHDALGREVYWYNQPRQQGITLDTQQWENGIYYISIWLDGKIIQEKIQVLR